MQVHAALLQQKNALQREIDRAAREDQELQRAIDRAEGTASAAVDETAGGGGVKGQDDKRERGEGKEEEKEEAGGQSELEGVTREGLGGGVPGSSSLRTKSSAAVLAVNSRTVSDR